MCFRMPRKFRTILTLAMVLTSASAFDATESITATPKTTPEVRQVVVPNATSTTTTSPDLPMDNTVTRQDLIASINRSKDFPDGFWDCPNITGASIECSCDFPHTLRCTGDRNSLQVKPFLFYQCQLMTITRIKNQYLYFKFKSSMFFQ